jgi:hypothetical protein
MRGESAIGVCYSIWLGAWRSLISHLPWEQAAAVQIGSPRLAPVAQVEGATAFAAHPAASVAAPVVPAVTLAMAATARLPFKSPGLAGLLSAMWPGVGQLYTGRAVGLAQMIFIPCGYEVLISLAFFALAIGEFLIAALLVLATLWTWMKVIEDTAKGAQRINAVRTNARAAVRAARGAGYAPVRPLLHTGPMQAAPVIAASRAKFTPPAWETRAFGFMFVFVCTIALIALLAALVSSFA